MPERPFLQVFSARLLTCLTTFFKVPSSFGVEPPAPPPPPKTPVIARTIVEIVIEKAASNENIVMLCSENKERILFANDVS